MFFSSNNTNEFFGSPQFGDFLSSLFADEPRRGPGEDNKRFSRSPRVFKLNVTLEDLFRGAVKECQFTHLETCQQCEGTTVTPPARPRSCDGCGGSGQQTLMRELLQGFVQRVVRTCSECRGSGSVLAAQRGSQPCGRCSAKGVVEVTESKDVKIPPGTASDETIVDSFFDFFFVFFCSEITFTLLSLRCCKVLEIEFPEVLEGRCFQETSSSC